MEELSKQERQERYKEERELERIRNERKLKIKKFGIWILVLGIVGALGFWGFKELTKPLPGTRFDDLGRDHVNDIGGVTYNSNPPTSGPHFPVWAKKGVYDRIISDGYLIHSLEHGYSVISYDCTKKFAVRRSQSGKLGLSVIDIFAHETVDSTITSDEERKEESPSSVPLTKMTVFPTDTKSWITPDAPPEIEVELPDSFNTDQCRSLVKYLSSFVSKWDRIVVVPRPNMDYPIVLTAWRRMENLDSLDKDKIEEFIRSYHNRGPEQTME